MIVNDKTRMAMVLGAVSALTLVLTASSFSAAFAQNPHFVGGVSCTVDQQGTLRCSGKIAGLGSADTATFTTTGTVSDVCLNKGENAPTGQQGGVQQSSPGTTVPVGKNGQISYSDQIPAPQPTSKCQGQGLHRVFTWDDVFVTINGEVVEIGGPFTSR